MRSVTKQVFKQDSESAGIMILGFTPTHTPTLLACALVKAGR